MKVLVKKTFHFVDDVWSAYIRWKITDLRYVVSGWLVQLHIVKYILDTWWYIILSHVFYHRSLLSLSFSLSLPFCSIKKRILTKSEIGSGKDWRNNVPQFVEAIVFSAQPYSEIDENDSDVDSDDRDDDLLADGEGVPEDDIEEVEPQEWIN